MQRHDIFLIWREDLKQSGVYFLFGASDETGKGIVYVGQAGARKNGEGILNRLQEHKRSPEKDYWTEAVVFTTYNTSFGPTEVKNGNDPTPGNITEEKESELEEFIDYAKVIMGTLGHKVFEPLNRVTLEQGKEIYEATEEGRLLHLNRTIKNVCVVEAEGKQTTEGFVVLKGSHISPEDDDTVPAAVKERRKSAPIDGNGKLTEDLLFASPSYAARFVIGKSAKRVYL